VTSGHQKWASIYDSASKAVYVECDTGWVKHLPIYRPTTYSTRAAVKPWYDKEVYVSTEIDRLSLVPASILHNSNTDRSIFQISIGTSQLWKASENAQSDHFIVGDKPGEVLPHPYYCELMQWDTNDITPKLEDIAQAILSSDLHICADGAYRKIVGQASHAWVFSTGQQEILWKGAGPTLGHTKLMTPYRAELTGLVSVLFILHWVCSHIQLKKGGSIFIYCHNETALSETFKQVRPTNNPYKMLAVDADLITLSRDLLLWLPITVTLKHKWVKGHYQGKHQLSHELNHIADKLAGKFNAVDRPSPTSSPILPPLYEAELIHKHQMITSRMGQVITSIMHDHQLRHCIQKQANWSETVFDRVDWVAHQQAYQSYKQPQRIRVSKLVHGLLHTNKEANKLYGSHPSCPCCNLTAETFNCIFRCQEEETPATHNDALNKLHTELERLQTP
jgi:hypothetical protein